MNEKEYLELVRLRDIAVALRDLVKTDSDRERLEAAITGLEESIRSADVVEQNLAEAEDAGQRLRAIVASSPALVRAP